MPRFGLFGAGRIGRMHARNLSSIPGVDLAYVYDVHRPSAAAAGEETGAAVADDPEEILNDANVDAVFIASSTDTHCDLIERSVAAGKTVLCEKPIHLDIARVEACRQAIGDGCNRVQIAFNRRFDPNHLAVKQAVQSGEIGRLEKLIITSRDPEPPPLDYIRISGGLFRDMMIHDFDLARFLMAEEPVEVTALASAIISDEVREAGDIDTAMVVMRMESGALCHINCSRRCSYGYDQRVEAFGSEGMVIDKNPRATTLERWRKKATASREPLLHFFIERYADSYFAEVRAFVDAVSKGEPPSPAFEDGRRALILADAALQSLKTGQTVKVDYGD